MKTNLSPDAKFKFVHDGVYGALGALGFARSGSDFKLVQLDCAAIVQLQRSVSNTAESIRFTVNVGIVCGAIYPNGMSNLKKAKLIDAHLTLRVGDFLPGSPDKWWLLDNRSDEESVKREVISILIDSAIPFVIEHASAPALAELWRSGSSPGITEVQRERYLDELSSLGF